MLRPVAAPVLCSSPRRMSDADPDDLRMGRYALGTVLLAGFERLIDALRFDRSVP